MLKCNRFRDFFEVIRQIIKSHTNIVNQDT